MLGKIFFFLLSLSVIYGVFRGNLAEFDGWLLSGAAESVKFLFSLSGAVCFFCGIGKIAERTGLSRKLSVIFRFLLSKLMPSAFSESKIAENVTMNLSSNLLGLGSAATPFGIKATEMLLKKDGGITRSVALFILLNTSSLQLLPSTVIALRSAAGAENPSIVVLPVILTQIVSAVFAVLLSFVFFGEKK